MQEIEIISRSLLSLPHLLAKVVSHLFPEGFWPVCATQRTQMQTHSFELRPNAAAVCAGSSHKNVLVLHGLECVLHQMMLMGRITDPLASPCFPSPPNMFISRDHYYSFYCLQYYINTWTTIKFRRNKTANLSVLFQLSIQWHEAQADCTTKACFQRLFIFEDTSSLASHVPDLIPYKFRAAKCRNGAASSSASCRTAVRTEMGWDESAKHGRLRTLCPGIGKGTSKRSHIS